MTSVQRLAEIRGHIKSVSGIRQVCRTMATVSSAKLSKARDQALGLRVYSGKLRGVVERQQAALGRRPGAASAALSPLLVEPASRRSCSCWRSAGDRGLCGGYNIAISRTARAFAEERTRGGLRGRLRGPRRASRALHPPARSVRDRGCRGFGRAKA